MPSRDIPESSVSKIKIYWRNVTTLRYPRSYSAAIAIAIGLNGLDWTGRLDWVGGKV